MWKYRYYLTQNKKALTKFLQCFDLNLEFEAGKPVSNIVDGFDKTDESISSHLSKPFTTAADFDEDYEI